jgi:hypothetical protein
MDTLTFAQEIHTIPTPFTPLILSDKSFFFRKKVSSIRKLRTSVVISLRRSKILTASASCFLYLRPGLRTFLMVAK